MAATADSLGMPRGGGRALATLSALTIVVAVIVAYLPTFGAGFVWDDDLHLIDNPVLREDGLYRVWVLHQGPVYYPVAFSSYWLEYHLWGLNPAGYHAVNVVLHAISALLFAALLRELRLAGRIAVVAALLFALHPQNVEAVAWIAQRKTLLAMVFFLCTAHAYLRFDRRAGGLRWPWYACALGFFGLGMLSKGSIAPLPLVLLLCLAWRRPLRATDPLPIAPFMLLALLVTLQEVTGQDRIIGEDVLGGDSLRAKLAVAGHAMWFYPWKTLFPLELSFVYPRFALDPNRFSAWVPLVGVLLASSVPVLQWRCGGRYAGAGRAVTFAGAYYGLMILPALGFADFYYLRYAHVADHYQYHAQLGIAALLAAALVRIPSERGFQITVGTLLIALAVLSHRQCLAYKDEETLWRHTLARNPDTTLALNNLGTLLAQRGEYGQALPLFARATEVDPSNREAWLNAGRIFETRAEHESALACFRQALQHWPGWAATTSTPAEALSLAAAHVQLGQLLASVGQLDAATYHYRQAIHHDPDDTQARIGLANVRLARGEVRRAIRLYREAATLSPEAPEALRRLTLIYASHPDARFRDAALAVETGERAAELTERRDAMVLDALAAAYAEAHRFDAADVTVSEALRLVRRTGPQELVSQLDARREAYRRGEPHRMTKMLW